jgi:hypothetical protein
MAVNMSISGSQGDDYEDGHLLRCYEVQCGRTLATFHRRFALMMEAVNISDTSVKFCWIKRLSIREGSFSCKMSLLVCGLTPWMLVFM